MPSRNRLIPPGLPDPPDPSDPFTHLTHPTQPTYGVTQAQLAASFNSPVPEYFAYCGYGQSGRDNPVRSFLAAIVIGVSPFSLHFSIVAIVLNLSGPSPPWQCPMPGTMKSFAKSFVSCPPIFF